MTEEERAKIQQEIELLIDKVHILFENYGYVIVFGRKGTQDAFIAHNQPNEKFVEYMLTEGIKLCSLKNQAN